MAETVTDRPSTAGTRPALRRRATGVLMMLLLELALGMIVNLYVAIPAHHPGAGDSGSFLTGAVTGLLWSFDSGIAVLVLHVVVGILLFVSAAELLVRAVRARAAASIWLASAGLLTIVAAGINGASFLKYRLDINSLLMSTGFVVAAGCYVFILADQA